MFTSILIPTDGSEKAVIAASKAVELAKEQGAKLTAVVVIDPFPYIGLGEASAFGLQAYLSEAQAMATQSLDGCARHGGRGWRSVYGRNHRAECGF